jgi:hypothetical protein
MYRAGADEAFSNDRTSRRRADPALAPHVESLVDSGRRTVVAIGVGEILGRTGGSPSS